MAKCHAAFQTLTYGCGQQAVFLTLITIITIVSTFTHADPIPPDYTLSDREHINQATTYLRQQVMQSASILPSEVVQTAKWFSGGWHSVSTGDGNDGDAPPAPPSSAPVANQPSAPDNKIFNIQTSFHHKDFLPTHDAFVTGVGMNQNIIDNKLGVTARPFYGQSWHSLHSYYGSEVAMNIAKRNDDDMPWGKIAVGYVGGTDNMTDHGRGMEVHGDVDLTQGWKLTSGVRQNSSDGNSNYMMLRWKLALD